MTDTGFAPHSPRTDWWSRRPRRSRSDSKVAGVAGGLGHYLGVDPVLFRVGFVALTIVGGVGILAYALLWLLLPAEGDEVSAGEALLGRGQSSVSPILAAVLAIAVILSITASFSWGLPFWPALIVGGIAFHVARRRQRGPFRPGSEWERRMRVTADDLAANRWSGASPTDTHRSSGRDWGSCGGHGRPAADRPQPGADSPFDTPAFWDAPAGDTPTTAQPPVDPFRKRGPAGAVGDDASSGAAEPSATPPAWDPLGAAPFAWDLPDVDLTPTDRAPARSRTTSPVIARVTMGIALLTIAVQVLGLIAGWWSPAWAVISAVALTVVAIGLLVQALRGRTLTLVGPGVLLSVVTLALSVTGFRGKPTFGDVVWTPTAADIQREYRLDAGDVTLDLRNVTPREGQTIETSVILGAGSATVLVPVDVNVNVDCTADVGQIDCMGALSDGVRQSVSTGEDVPGNVGTINLRADVNAGEVRVSR